MTTAPSKYWYVEKNGTPVKRYQTAGTTQIKLPESVNAISVGSNSELVDIETDQSVLTDEEKDILGVVER